MTKAVSLPSPTAERQRIVLAGDVPNSIDPPSGYRFRTRCPYAEPVWGLEDPGLIELSPGHFVACHVVSRAFLRPS